MSSFKQICALSPVPVTHTHPLARVIAVNKIFLSLTPEYFENNIDIKNILKGMVEKGENKKIEIKKFLDSLNLDLTNYSFVATAGTPTTIAAIKLGQDFFSYDRNIVNGATVNLEDLIFCLNIFKDSSQEEITRLVGRGRVEFIEVGIFIYKTIFEVLNKKESIVLDEGLREGVAINYCLTKCKN